MTIDAVIEIPLGSRNKYEVDKNDKTRIRLDRVLYSSVTYPAEYGFIENTLADDGDALDILVLSTSKTFPGCIVNARVLGYLKIIDQGKIDNKIIAVPTGDPRYNEYNSIDDIPPHTKDEIREFFNTYKDLQGIDIKVGDYYGLNEAIKVINEAKENFTK